MTAIHESCLYLFPFLQNTCNLYICVTKSHDFSSSFFTLLDLSYFISHPRGSSLDGSANRLTKATKSRLCWYRSNTAGSLRILLIMCFRVELRLKSAKAFCWQRNVWNVRNVWNLGNVWNVWNPSNVRYH